MYISTKTHELETNLAEWIQRCLAAGCYVLGTVTISFARWAVLALGLMILNDPPPYTIFHPYSFFILTYMFEWTTKSGYIYIYVFILKKCCFVVNLSICHLNFRPNKLDAFWHRPMAVPPRHGHHAPEQRRSPIAAGGAPEQHLAPAVAPPALEPASPRAAGTWRPGRPGGTFCISQVVTTSVNPFYMFGSLRSSRNHATVLKIIELPHQWGTEWLCRTSLVQ